MAHAACLIKNLIQDISHESSAKNGEFYTLMTRENHSEYGTLGEDLLLLEQAIQRERARVARLSYVCREIDLVIGVRDRPRLQAVRFYNEVLLKIAKVHLFVMSRRFNELAAVVSRVHTTPLKIQQKAIELDCETAHVWHRDLQRCQVYIPCSFLVEPYAKMEDVFFLSSAISTEAVLVAGQRRVWMLKEEESAAQKQYVACKQELVLTETGAMELVTGNATGAAELNTLGIRVKAALWHWLRAYRKARAAEWHVHALWLFAARGERSPASVFEEATAALQLEEPRDAWKLELGHDMYCAWRVNAAFLKDVLPIVYEV